MATIHSLVCWGGAAGKSVAINPTTDQITLTNHGLPAGTGVAFTSGTLPTVVGQPLAFGTIYYAKPITLSAFELYRDNALTDKIDFTSTGSSLIMKSAFYLGLTDKSRWTTDGVERIYDGLVSWNSGRASAKNTDVEVCEIGMAFSDYGPTGSAFIINVPAAVVIIESKINGNRTSAFHYGRFDLGYEFVINYDWGNVTIPLFAKLDGVRIKDPRTAYRNFSVLTVSAYATAENVQTICTGSPQETTGINLYGANARAINCCAIGHKTGIYIYQYNNHQAILNCTVSKCTGVGVSCGNTGGANGQASYVVNTVSLGNATNWYSTNVTNLNMATNNVGGVGEAWVKSPGIRIETTESSPFSSIFKDWANNDFRPKDVESILVENGTNYFWDTGKDITGSVRPAYPGGEYDTEVQAGSFVVGLRYKIASLGDTDFTAVGASSNTVGIEFKATGVGSGTGTAVLLAANDVGAYECDLGYGPWPATTTVTFVGVPSGSEIRVYDDDGNEVAGIESCSADQTLSWAIPSNPVVRVVIVGLGFRIIEFDYVSVAGEQSVPVNAEIDRWYLNP